MIFRGEKKVTSIYRGDNEVVAVYRGTDKIWGKPSDEGVVPDSTVLSGTILTEKEVASRLSSKLGVECSSRDEVMSTLEDMIGNGVIDESILSDKEFNCLLFSRPAHYNFGLGDCLIDANGQGEFCVDLSDQVINYHQAFVGDVDAYNTLVRITSLPTAPDQTDTWHMFAFNPFLEYIDATQIKVSQLNQEESSIAMFVDCDALRHIRCTTAFRDWCWANADSLFLPDAMREGDDGTWELIDDAQQIM